MLIADMIYPAKCYHWIPKLCRSTWENLISDKNEIEVLVWRWHDFCSHDFYPSKKYLSSNIIKHLFNLLPLTYSLARRRRWSKHLLYSVIPKIASKRSLIFFPLSKGLQSNKYRISNEIFFQVCCPKHNIILTTLSLLDDKIWHSLVLLSILPNDCT